MSPNNIFPLRLADTAKSVRHVFIRDLVLDAEIGIHPHERGATQQIRINISLAVPEGAGALPDELDAVVCYEEITNKVIAIVKAGHLNLVETMGERIAAMCLEDKRIDTVRVRIEKLEAIEAAASVGIEIERTRLSSD